MGSPASEAVQRDRAALVALYEATDGANWDDHTGWLSDAPLGDWYGVTTDAEGRVTNCPSATTTWPGHSRWGWSVWITSSNSTSPATT